MDDFLPALKMEAVETDELLLANADEDDWLLLKSASKNNTKNWEYRKDRETS